MFSSTQVISPLPSIMVSSLVNEPVPHPHPSECRFSSFACTVEMKKKKDENDKMWLCSKTGHNLHWRVKNCRLHVTNTLNIQPKKNNKRKFVNWEVRMK